MRSKIGFLALAASLLPAAWGASIVYLNNSGVTDLSDGAAWDGGVAPGADDVAVFDGTLPDTLTIPANAAWLGIVRTNIANAVTFTGGPLTLGTDGITCFTVNQDFYRTYLPDIVLAGAQTWTLTTNKALCVSGSVTGTGPLTLYAPEAYNTLFYGDVEPTGGVLTSGKAYVWAMRGARFAQAPSMLPDTYFLCQADGTGTVAFADVIASRAFANNGMFSFGSKENDTSMAADIPPVVTLAAGDSLGGTDAANSSRSKQLIHVQDTHVVVDGGDVTGNSWFYLRSGSWTQLSGDTAFNYAALIGRGISSVYKCQQQRLTISGGTFTARRMSVGMANEDAYPAEVFMTGGSYASTLPNGSDWASALAIGQRLANGETTWSNEEHKSVNLDSQYASARFEMTGGTVTTPSILFGNDYNIDGKKDLHTASRFALRGGTLRLGLNGIRKARYWDANDSHYDCVLSGGTFTFYKNDADSQADMRLSDRDGGTSFCTSNNVTSTRIYGSLYGSGGFRKIGPGTLRLTGANDYTGRTDVVEGSLYTGADCAFAVDAIWQADDFFDLGAGTQVGDWTNRGGIGPWTFKNAGTIDTFRGMNLSSPTVAATTMNGHAELAFDGTRAMFVTGNAAQPISEKDKFTIACVLRVEEGTVGGGSGDWQDATVIMGCSLSSASTLGSRYGLALNANGCIGCGMKSTWQADGANVTTNETLWSTTPINDGKPHVVVWTWEYGQQHTLRVDNETVNCNSVSNGCKKTIKTRFILGAGEYAPTKRFRGTIADLRMTPWVLNDAGYARVLGLRYGVEAFAPGAAPSAPSTETVPTATATWDAESLTQTDGQTVTEWPEKDGKGATSSSTWKFTSSLADNILSTRTLYAGTTVGPTIARGPDGHKLVSFNGTNACMALTGSANTPVSDAGSMTVAMVVRFTGYGSSGGNFTSKGTTTGFFGESFAPSGRQWLLTLTGSARVGACMEWSNQAGAVALRSARRFLDDGELHVIVVSYPPIGTDQTMIFALDGVTTTLTCSPANNISKTRILLGGAEQGSKARYAPVDVAEFRFWKNVALTAGQVETLTKELCAKYNVYDEGFERGRAVDRQQRSREVFVHEGASYGAPVNLDFTLWPDQTIWGDGSVVGHMYVAPGATVKTTATNTLTTAAVEFADGATLKAECGANGAVNPLSVTGDVWFPDGTVTVDVQGVKPLPNTPLLTWTGAARLRGTTEFVPADLNSGMTFRIDTANRRLVVAPPSGTIISIR